MKVGITQCSVVQHFLANPVDYKEKQIEIFQKMKRCKASHNFTTKNQTKFASKWEAWCPQKKNPFLWYNSMNWVWSKMTIAIFLMETPFTENCSDLFQLCWKIKSSSHEVALATRFRNRDRIRSSLSKALLLNLRAASTFGQIPPWELGQH